jgi:hypothetical protein
MQAIWQRRKELWKSLRSIDELSRLEAARLRQEMRLAPGRHWATGICVRDVLVYGARRGARSFPEAFDKLRPGEIEAYWQEALPRARREVVWDIWTEQAQDLGVWDDWAEAFAAVG